MKKLLSKKFREQRCCHKCMEFFYAKDEEQYICDNCKMKELKNKINKGE